jgi:GMP synthase-like glutamine amidotransferase
MVIFKDLGSSVSTGKTRESGSIPAKLKGRFLFQSTKNTISEGHLAAHSTGSANFSSPG